MSPLGKLTFAILGLRFFGAEGFLVGMMLGHFAVDRTHLTISLKRRLSIIDDNIRILLPYKFYHYYNQVEGHFWGKLWGALLGTILFGWYGFIVLFIMGHFVFDTPDSYHAKKYRQKAEDFFDAHWGKICGAIVGFVLQSDIILFCGVIIGFFGDYLRMENTIAWWKNLSPLKWWKYSANAKHRAFIRAVAALAAKTAKIDGAVSENEIRVFRQLFEISEDDSSIVAKVFNYEKKSTKKYEVFCHQLKKMTEENLDLKETIIDNLFQIAKADGELKVDALDFLAKIATEIGLPSGNFEVLKKLHTPKAKDKKMQKCYEILGVICSASDEEVRAKWKELIVRYHPDRIQSQGANENEIKKATAKMAEINQAYQEVMKIRSVR